MSVFQLNRTQLSETTIVPDERYNNPFGLFQLQLEAVQEEHEIFKTLIARDFAESAVKSNEETSITEAQLISLNEATFKELREKIIKMSREFIAKFNAAMKSVISKLKTKIDYYGKVAKMYGGKAIKNSSGLNDEFDYTLVDKEIKLSTDLFDKYQDAISKILKNNKGEFDENVDRLSDEMTVDKFATRMIDGLKDDATGENIYKIAFKDIKKHINAASTKDMVDSLSKSAKNLKIYTDFNKEVDNFAAALEKVSAELLKSEDNETSKKLNYTLFSKCISCINGATSKVVPAILSAHISGMNKQASAVIRLAKMKSSDDIDPVSKTKGLSGPVATGESSKYFEEQICKEDEFGQPYTPPVESDGDLDVKTTAVTEEDYSDDNDDVTDPESEDIDDMVDVVDSEDPDNEDYDIEQEPDPETEEKVEVFDDNGPDFVEESSIEDLMKYATELNEEVELFSTENED